MNLKYHEIVAAIKSKNSVFRTIIDHIIEAYIYDPHRISAIKQLMDKGGMIINENNSSDKELFLVPFLYNNKVAGLGHGELRLDLAKFLIERGANLDATDGVGGRPLIRNFLSQSLIGPVRLFIERGVQLPAFEGRSCLNVVFRTIGEFLVPIVADRQGAPVATKDIEMVTKFFTGLKFMDSFMELCEKFKERVGVMVIEAQDTKYWRGKQEAFKFLIAFNLSSYDLTHIDYNDIFRAQPYLCKFLYTNAKDLFGQDMLSLLDQIEYIDNSTDLVDKNLYIIAANFLNSVISGQTATEKQSIIQEVASYSSFFNLERLRLLVNLKLDYELYSGRLFGNLELCFVTNIAIIEPGKEGGFIVEKDGILSITSEEPEKNIRARQAVAVIAINIAPPIVVPAVPIPQTAIQKVKAQPKKEDNCLVM